MTDTETSQGYADALAELDDILSDLEADDIDVDALATKVERAAELIRLCQGRIATARVQVEKVVADLDELQTVDTDDDEPDDALFE
ncbi:MAG: exodeoxyribonuclease VII small subunit [Acidimicrobiales bacterium]